MDIIIIGTGASAMLLAQSLIQRKCFRSLRIIGPARGVHTIRFSYWSGSESTPFDRFTDASWSNLIAFGATGSQIDIPLSRFEYRSLDAQAWISELHRDVRAARGVDWIETMAEEIAPSSDGVTVYTPLGQFEADWVFSSGGTPAASPTCWQRFEGWNVNVVEPMDQESATLMDFRTPAEGDFRFIYALPLGPHQLFIEHVSYQPCDHAAHIRTHLDTVLAPNGWECLETERGATPAFRTPPPRRDGRHVRIGVAGGLAKTATGYALLRMWRDAEGIAEGLSSREQPRLTKPIGGLHKVADHFFLHLLQHAPHRLPGLMESLFAGTSGDSVLAFLDDRATIREQIDVALSTPGWFQWLVGAGSRRRA